MYNPFIILLFLFPTSLITHAQTQKKIHQALAEIKDIPALYKLPESHKIRRRDRKTADEAYQYILHLDTIAIPYLINELSDTTSTSIINGCTQKNFKRGDIAYCLLNNIVPVMPMHLITNSEWDLFMFCGGVQVGVWEYINMSRTRYQAELAAFFGSIKGRSWIQLIKHKNNLEEQ